MGATRSHCEHPRRFSRGWATATQGESQVLHLNPHVPQGPRTADPSQASHPDCSQVSPAGRAVCGQVQPVGRWPETALPQAGKELGVRASAHRALEGKGTHKGTGGYFQKGTPHMLHARAACIASNHPSSQGGPIATLSSSEGPAQVPTLSPMARPAQGPRPTTPPNPGHGVT